MRAVAYDHPDAAQLIARVQLEYTARYGTPDEGPADAAQFVPPTGLFGVAYVAGEPVAMGGWRYHDGGVAEIKRMYVADGHRGRGLARQLLAWLESTAWAAGHSRLVLETGLVQPEAIALYRSSGYTDVPAFGYYAGSDLSVYLGKSLSGADPSPSGADSCPTGG
ncbi:MAG: GNAT family N-acetyltransferase [Nocardioidaceae bacterium]